MEYKVVWTEASVDVDDEYAMQLSRTVVRVRPRGELPQENLALGLIATGDAVEEERAQAERELDFFDLKGALEAAVDWMNLSALTFTPASVRHLRVGQSALIRGIASRA